MCDIVMLGASGYLGSHILSSLEAAGMKVVCSKVRLTDRVAIDKLLDEQKPSLGIVCAAGERGRPNISWCDSHPVETADANLTGQFNVAGSAHARGLHCVLIGTGSLYKADDSLVQPVKEETPPNNVASGVYVAQRAVMEDVLTRFGFDNTLVLRILYPMSSDLDQRGLLGKLARFKTVDKVKTSVTIIEDLCPLIPDLVRRRVSGILNFTNPGTVAYAEIVELLGTLDLKGWQAPTVREGTAGRGAAELDATKMETALGVKIPDATTSLRRIIQRLKDSGATLSSPAPPSKL